ncbi:MAG: 50S ribosomal protein L21 [Defluviitaleaceae bacterium]|nr:50S ribosomal protein L21 [Defluviitaleaceae bacterium]
MYAIIETGGKQFKVSQGDIIKVEKLCIEPGETHTFEQVLLLANGEKLVVGAPYISGVKVTATVTKQDKAKKVIIYKYKAKKGFHKKKGHRQPFTELKIESISV